MTDLDYALEQAEDAREALDDALSGYEVDDRHDLGAIALRQAHRAAVHAVAEVERDRDGKGGDGE